MLISTEKTQWQWQMPNELTACILHMTDKTSILNFALTSKKINKTLQSLIFRHINNSINVNYGTLPDYSLHIENYLNPIAYTAQMVKISRTISERINEEKARYVQSLQIICLAEVMEDMMSVLERVSSTLVHLEVTLLAYTDIRLKNNSKRLYYKGTTISTTLHHMSSSFPSISFPHLSTVRIDSCIENLECLTLLFQLAPNITLLDVVFSHLRRLNGEGLDLNGRWLSNQFPTTKLRDLRIFVNRFPLPFDKGDCLRTFLNLLEKSPEVTKLFFRIGVNGLKEYMMQNVLQVVGQMPNLVDFYWPAYPFRSMMGKEGFEGLKRLVVQQRNWKDLVSHYISEFERANNSSASRYLRSRAWKSSTWTVPEGCIPIPTSMSFALSPNIVKSSSSHPPSLLGFENLPSYILSTITATLSYFGPRISRIWTSSKPLRARSTQFDIMRKRSYMDIFTFKRS